MDALPWGEETISGLSQYVDIFFPQLYNTASPNVYSFHYGIINWTTAILANTNKAVIPFVPFFYQAANHDPSIENIDTAYNALRNVMALSKVSFDGMGIFDIDQFTNQDCKYWIVKSIYPSKLTTYWNMFFNDRTLSDVNITPISDDLVTVNLTVSGASLDGAQVSVFSSNRDIPVIYTSGYDTYTIMSGNNFSFQLGISDETPFAYYTIEIAIGNEIHYIDNVPFGIEPV